MRIPVIFIQIEAQIEGGRLFPVYLVTVQFLSSQKLNVTEPDIFGPFQDGW
jgi:hypothetical protein